MAIVHPIQAPMPRMATKPMSTGAATTHMRMASKAGQKRAVMYAAAMARHAMSIVEPMV